MNTKDKENEFDFLPPAEPPPSFQQEKDSYHEEVAAEDFGMVEDFGLQMEFSDEDLLPDNTAPSSLNIGFVGVGGGGLIAGIATALSSLAPETRIFGVEPEGAAAMTLALEAGSVVRLDDVNTIADGLAPPFAGKLNLAIVERLVESVVRVTDVEIRYAMALLLERTKLLVEPAGAAAFAALMNGKIPVELGARVAVILSGGNVDVQRLAELLPGHKQSPA